MLTLKAGAVISAETEVKRSRFICTLARTDTEEQAREIIRQAKAAYPDARHHCNAFVVSLQGMNPQLHSSDDGEPAGTAGTPMLEVLRHHDLVNVTAVVTRYFGGTLLGTGGLVRAYSGAVIAALDQAPRVAIVERIRYAASIPLAKAGKVEAELRAADWALLSLEWGTDLAVEVAGAEGQEAELHSFLSGLVQAPVVVRQAGTIRTEVDIQQMGA